MSDTSPVASKAVIKNELPKSRSHIIVEIAEYVPDSIVSKTIIRKSTGAVTATSFDEGEDLCERKTEYDTYVQIIDGKADLTIGTELHVLKLGEGIIIPAGTLYCFDAKEQFKTIITTMKEGSDGEIATVVK